MTTVFRDMRQGFRQLVRRPAFSVAAVGSLALGIGLTTTLLSVVNAVLLRKTTIERPETLVEIYTSLPDFPQFTTSYPDYLDLRASVDALSGVAGHAFVRGILATGDRPQLVTGEAVTDNYFDVLGLRPAAGRAFRADENVTPNAVPVVVLSHGLWQRTFGGRADVVGETIDLSGRRYTVVGIAPAGFSGTLPGIPVDVWVPAMMVEQLEFSGMQAVADEDPGTTRLDRRGQRWLFLKGRISEGRTIEQARSQLEAVFARLREEHPRLHDRIGVSVLPADSVRFHPMLDGYVRAASVGLLAAVGLVLLIACANVANLLLARGSSRRRELAIRAAIGAGRGRLVRQLLSEGLVLAAAGGVAGALLAVWASRLMVGLGTDVLPFPVDFHVSVDGTVLAFAAGVSLVTALLFGLVPAWSASRLDLVPALKQPVGAGDGSRRRRVTLSDGLVVAQLSLSLLLLVAGALLGRGLFAARSTDIGFDPAPIASLSFNPQMNGYDLDRAIDLRTRVLDALRALPGVEAASLSTRLPLAPDMNISSIKVPGHHTAADDATLIDSVSIGADYFDVVGVPLVAGRAFTDDDIVNRRNVAIVNETLARQYWPDGSAVGRSFHNGELTQPPVEIVGVARDHKVRSVGESPRPYLHEPAYRSQNVTLIVRTTTPAVAALPMLRQAVWSIEPNVIFTSDVSAAEIAAMTMAPTEIGAAVLGAFGGLALLLAAVGLYGVIAYSVSLRTREVGIRMALGAARGQVLRLIFAEGGRLALVGVLLGSLASLGVGHVLSSMLYGVSPMDPIAFAMAAGVLAFVAGLANVVPALAAARIDPLNALRRD
ncbi:MAG TPA: ABC transporter permease [Vicinamibacterales bacterium]|nr:ABC transporter permease [Vicinamibacterales bacterium]